MNIQALDAKSKEAAAFQDESLACENRWGLCTRKAVSKASKTRVFTQWRDVTLNKKVNMQIIHTAFASTSTRWFRRSLKHRFLEWKLAAVSTVSIADTISISYTSRSVRWCFDDWLMCARSTARQVEHAAVEKNTTVMCEQVHERAAAMLKKEMTAQTSTLLQDKQQECKALHEQAAAVLKEEMTTQTTMLLQNKQQECNTQLKLKDSEASERVSSLQTNHTREIATLEQTLETKTRELEKAVADLREEHVQHVAANTQAHKEEMIKINHLLEAKRSEMDTEVSSYLYYDHSDPKYEGENRVFEKSWKKSRQILLGTQKNQKI